ncbi:MAG: acyloxyacyl hydrolase [Vicinamibacterales bacterium]
MAALILGWATTLASASPPQSPGAQFAAHRDSPPRGGAEASDASTEPAESAAGSPASEWMLGAGRAASVELFHSRTGIRYAVQTVSWARDLTRDLGPRSLRGRLAWTIELMPLLVQLAPSRVYAIGIAPVGLRWNLVPRRHWSAFTELSGGFLGSSAPLPDGLARFNFTAHWATGVRVPAGDGQALVLAYRLQHISNGNRLPTNPGINSHVVFAGWSVVDR